MRSSRVWLASAGTVGISAVVACGSFESADAPPASADAAGPADTGIEPIADAPPDGPTAPCTGAPCGSPIVLAAQKSADRRVVSLAAFGSHVLWMTSADAWAGGGPGDLFAVDRAGGAAPVKIASDQITADLASDGTRTFASFAFGNRRLVQIDENLGVTEVESQSTAHVLSINMHVQSDGLVFASMYDTGGAPNQFIRRDTSEQVIVSFGANLELFAVGADRVFGAQSRYRDIVTCPKSGCTDLATFVAGAEAAALAASDDRLFWIGGGDVHTCAAAVVPCAAPTVALSQASLGSPAAVLAVERGALFVGTEAGDLFRCDPASCTSTSVKIAHDTEIGDRDLDYRQSRAIVQDEQAVYWVATDRDADAGFAGYRIMMLRK